MLLALITINTGQEKTVFWSAGKIKSRFDPLNMPVKWLISFWMPLMTRHSVTNQLLSLSEEDIEELDNFLMSEATSYETMSIDTLDGYLTAIVIGPGHQQQRVAI
jgi:hypothetical protein